MTATKPTKPLSLAKQYAHVENISIFGITERMGPLGLQLYAESFLRAAQALPKPSVPFEPVRPYLVCHAVELGLKAFLALKGLSMLELSDSSYGHKLIAILEKAEGAGLLATVPLSEEHRTAIRIASDYYAGKVFEYPAVGEALSSFPSMPPLDVLFDAADRLIEAMAKPCRAAK